MGQIKIFQRHGANVVAVRNFHLVLVFFLHIFVQIFIIDQAGACPCFRPIPGFPHYILSQNVLLFKEHFQSTLYLVNRPRPFMPSAQYGDKNIGIVFYIVEVKMVFVIIVVTFVVVQLLL